MAFRVPEVRGFLHIHVDGSYLQVRTGIKGLWCQGGCLGGIEPVPTRVCLMCFQGAVLINTSRGPLIDTQAVITALKAKTLGGLGRQAQSFRGTQIHTMTSPFLALEPRQVIHSGLYLNL
jgi:hypothetical protein